MPKKRILLVTSKYPYSKTESDGGLTTVASVIESLKGYCDLDVLLVRKFSQTENKIDGVNNIFFEEIEKKSSIKYERRIYNYKQVSNRILELESNYDFIIIIHASKAFGLDEASEDILRKVILYPMFLSYAYRESGEIVPETYDILEKKCMLCMKWIVCPSNYDKFTIQNHYRLPDSSFFVIPRSVSRFIKHNARERSEHNRILAIGNIKERKQPLKLLEIFRNVKMIIADANLIFAGEIQNEALYARCMAFVIENGLQKSVSFVGTVSQKQIGDLIATSDLNVCASNLETFGRCVFEGMYGGLPTVVFNQLTCVSEFVDNGHGVFFARDEDEFSQKIIDLFSDQVFYAEQSAKAIKSTRFISFENEKNSLRDAIESIERRNNDI